MQIVKKIYTGIELGTNSVKIIVAEKINNNFYVLASTCNSSMGIKNGANIPIVPESNNFDVNLYANPLPHVLMLTAIVVGVSTLAVSLSLLQKIFKEYKSIEEDEILKQMEEE